MQLEEQWLFRCQNKPAICLKPGDERRNSGLTIDASQPWRIALLELSGYSTRPLELEPCFLEEAKAQAVAALQQMGWEIHNGGS
jgi:hypothetical protein